MHTAQTDTDKAKRIAIEPRRIWYVMLMALGLCVFTTCSYIATQIFLSHPTTMDEYNFLYQAKIYAAGHLYLDIEPYMNELADMWMLTHKGHYFSKYPPAFSFILAGGVLMGVQVFVNPLISALSILAIARYIAHIHTYLIALLTALFLATNSYYLGYASSYYGHILCVLLTAGSFGFLVQFYKTSRWQHLHYASLCAAIMVFARPLDTAALMIALSAGLLAKDLKSSAKNLTILWVPVAISLLLFMSFNWYLRDCFCLATYRVWSTPEFHLVADASKGIWDNMIMVLNGYVENGKRNLGYLFIEAFVPYVGYPYLALLTLGMLRRWNRIMLISLLHIVAVIALYNFNHTNGYPIYGARYWYITLVSQSVFIAYGFQKLFILAPRKTVLALCAVLISIQIFQVTEDMYVYKRRAIMRATVHENILEQCPEKTIIRLPTHDAIANWPRYFWLSDYKRNAFFNNTRLYLFWAENAQRVKEHYPDYEICDYSFERFKDGVYFLPKYKAPLLNYTLRDG